MGEAVAGAFVVALLVVGWAASGAGAADSGQALVGTFRITAGACNGTAAAGSRFRMVVPSGGPGGPYVSNNDSPCGDKTYTPLAPGTDAGLVTGGYQAEPNPGFDGSGNSLAGRITKPTSFYGVAFSTSTNPVDPQTAAKVPAPAVSVANGKLSGDLRAFAASWNRQEFNQGAPKPDGSTPGNTAAPTGTYNESTGAFTLDWASQIQGGPFNNFTGLWHLEGTFTPAQGSPNTTTPASPSNTSQQGSTATTAATNTRSGSATTTVRAATTTSLPPAAAGASGPTTTATIGTLAAVDATEKADDTKTADASQAAASTTQHRKSSGVGGFAVLAALVLIAAAIGAWWAVRRRGRPAS